MLRTAFVLCSILGMTNAFGCAESEVSEPIKLSDDSPVAGVWYMQRGDQTGQGELIKFDFQPGGKGVYERQAADATDPERHAVTYNLTGDILSIASDSDDPAAPKLTGKIKLDASAGELQITTHIGERWVLSRTPPSDGRGSGQAADVSPGHGSAVQQDEQLLIDPMVERVRALVEACNLYAQWGSKPTQITDLISAGLIRPEDLLASGDPADLPSRYDRMTDKGKTDWLSANGVFVFFFDFAGTGQASSVLVATRPTERDSNVALGMANGLALRKPAMQAAQLLQYQLGKLPDGWPEAVWPKQTQAGLEPLSD